MTASGARRRSLMAGSGAVGLSPQPTDSAATIVAARSLEPTGRSPPANAPLVFELEHIGSVQIERRGAALVCAAKLSMTAIADGDILQTTIDDEIDERGRSENAV